MLTDSKLERNSKACLGFVKILKVEQNTKKEKCKMCGRKGPNLERCATK